MRRSETTCKEQGRGDNLEHTPFRQLSTTEGRWLSPDPAGLAAADLTNPQSLNLYAYDGNTGKHGGKHGGNTGGNTGNTGKHGDRRNVFPNRAVTWEYIPSVPVFITDASGNLLQTYIFDALGELKESTGSIANNFRYTGGSFIPEIGLYSLRARYFDPSLGRFLSEDPLLFRGGNNFYEYVSNRPTTMIDPTGLLGRDAALAGMIGQLANLVPGTEYAGSPQGPALIVPMDCLSLRELLLAQGYETGFFPPFNNPLDHSGGWEFRTHGPGFHFRMRYPDWFMGAGGMSAPPPPPPCKENCTLDQFHIDEHNPLDGGNNTWNHLLDFARQHGWL